ncbi:MAG: hypothetical protein ACI9LD_001945 [Polaromonas sp.]
MNEAGIDAVNFGVKTNAIFSTPSEQLCERDNPNQASSLALSLKKTAWHESAQAVFCQE